MPPLAMLRKQNTYVLRASPSNSRPTFVTNPPAPRLDVEKRGIDFVAANARRKRVPEIEITFHGGGEPTVHWKVMTESLQYAREVASLLGLGVKAYSRLTAS